MRPIRVLLSGLSGFRGAVVERIIAAQPDMTLVSDFIDDDTLLSGRAADLADVVIVAMDGDRIPALCGPLLYGHPNLRVLAMEDHGGDAVMYELRPHRMFLGDVSPEGLVAAVRTSVRPFVT